MSRIENAKRNIVWGLLNKLLSIFLPFVIRTLIIYLVGENYLGLDGLFSSILQMLNIAELGFSSAVVFSMYKPLADNDSKEVCALLALYRKTYRIIGALILAVSVILLPFLPKLIKSGLPDDVNLYVLYAFFVLNTVLGYWMFAYKKSLLSACQRADIISKINTLITLTKSGLQIFLLFIFKNYYYFVILMPIATVAENICAEVVSRKYFPDYIPRGKVSSGSAKSIIQRIKGLMIQKVCSTSRNSLDNLVISAYIGLTTITIYGNYYLVIKSAHDVMASITTAISGVVGNAVAKENVESNYDDMMMFSFMYLCIASIGTAVMLCDYQPLMHLWMKGKLLFPMYMVVLFCAYFFFLCINDIRSVYYQACGLWWEGRYRSIAEALSNLILNVLLGKFLGVAGIVLATLFSIVFINFGYGGTIIHKYYFKGISPVKFYVYHIYYAIVTALGCVICYKICSLITVPYLLQLFANGLICVAVMSLVLLICYFKLDVFKKSVSFIKKSIIPGKK